MNAIIMFPECQLILYGKGQTSDFIKLKNKTKQTKKKQKNSADI